MKIIGLNITTSYPNGYEREKPRLVTGEATIAVSDKSYHDYEHTISPEAMSRILEIVLTDYQMTPKEASNVPGLYVSQEAMPPVPAPLEDTTADLTF